MATEIAVHNQAPAAMSLTEMQRLAESVAKSRLFGIQTADQALTLMSIAQAEGRHPALAARDYHIINGSPAKKAEAMARDFLSAGGRIEWHQLDDAAADATFSHPAGGSARIRWDQDRVTRAGLGSNGMHKKYPRQMLRSRVVSEGVRTVWPMATSGMYVPEEVREFAPAAAPIDVTPKADLDAFAGGATPATLEDTARAAAARGNAAYDAWLATIPPSDRLQLRTIGTELDRIANEADARSRDPFGPPPQQQQAPAHDAPERSPPPDADNRKGKGALEDRTPEATPSAGAGSVEHTDRRGERPTAARLERGDAAAASAVVPERDENRDAPQPPAESEVMPDARMANQQPAPNKTRPLPSAVGARDLLGGEPAENLFVPPPRHPTAGDLEYYGRQMLAMIAEAPHDRSRNARIRLANEGGLLQMKAGGGELYHEITAALAARGRGDG